MKKLIMIGLSAMLALAPAAPLAQNVDRRSIDPDGFDSIEYTPQLPGLFAGLPDVPVTPEQLSFLSMLGIDEAHESIAEIDDLAPLKTKMFEWQEAEQLDLPLGLPKYRAPEQQSLGLFGNIDQLKKPIRLVMQTQMQANDESRMAVDFGLISAADLEKADFGFDSKEVAAIRPLRELTVSLNIVVPSGLSQEDESGFVEGVTAAFLAQHRDVSVKVRTIKIDLEKLEQESKKANEGIASALRDNLLPASSSLKPVEHVLDLPTDKFVKALESASVETAYLVALARSMIQKNKTQMKRFRAWRKGFIKQIKRLREWRNWTTREKDMFFAGTVVGGGKSSLSISYWLTATGVNTYGVLQSAMSLFMDVFFAAWGNKVESWKSKHQFRWFRNLKWVKWYNETPLVKAFVINNMIGFAAGFYFRLWSYLNNPDKVSSPWSFEALGTYLGAMSIGGLIGSAGGQGALTLRRKGWISARQELLLYQLYGLKMQVEGFLFGSGLTALYWMFFSGNMAFQSLVYGSSRVLPAKNPRALVIHPDLASNEELVESEKYLAGLLDAEDLQQLGAGWQERARPRKYMREREQIKEELQTFRSRIRLAMKGLTHKCEGLLTKGSSLLKSKK